MPFTCCVIVLPIPELLYLLHPGGFLNLEKFDKLILSFLQTVTNIQIRSSAWAQPILPAAKGGLGTCSAVDLTLPCYLFSIHSTSELVSSILLPSGLATDSSLS